MDSHDSTSKPKISFGLGSSTSRRPGVKSLSSTKLEDDLDSSKLQIPLSEPKSEPLIIPCTSPIPSPIQDASSQMPLLPFEPKKYGLQIRKTQVEQEGVAALKSGPILSLKRKPYDPSNELNVNNLPEETDNFEKVPINEFGAALLRGMGWKEGQGIGRNVNKIIEPIEPKPRPRGLGIGAEPDTLQNSPKTTSSLPTEFLGVGSDVNIISGEHQGMSGIVSELTRLTAIIDLSGSGERVIVERSLICLTNKIQKQSNTPLDDPAPIPGPSWLTPHIRVQVLSKSLLGGALYRKVAEVIDVHQDDEGITRAILRTFDGRMVSNVHDRQVIPVRPKIGQYALVLLDDKYQGCRGSVVGSDGNFYQIQLYDSLEIIPVKYDRLAELITL